MENLDVILVRRIAHFSHAFILVSMSLLSFGFVVAADHPSSFRLTWKDNVLTICGQNIPGDRLKVRYLEAYCRDGSTDQDWKRTTIGHRSELVWASEDGRQLRLKCTLNDGVIVTHAIRAVDDGVDFQLEAHNPTNRASRAHWAQPCIRVGRFTGAFSDDDSSHGVGSNGQIPSDSLNIHPRYIRNCFLFLDGKLSRMPTFPWATEGRYTPGQVWVAPGVNRDDVNPRPLSDLVPSSGLIGCFSEDESTIMATAWEPYQELFQGVFACLHSDFRIGGLRSGESKSIHGKIYLVENNIEKLLKRFHCDFPKRLKR